MNKWTKTNTRGFCITFSDGTTTTTQGPDLTADQVGLPFNLTRYKTIVSIDEYQYEDTIKWAIEAQQRQIEICLKRIKELEQELKT